MKLSENGFGGHRFSRKNAPNRLFFTPSSTFSKTYWPEKDRQRYPHYLPVF